MSDSSSHTAAAISDPAAAPPASTGPDLGPVIVQFRALAMDSEAAGNVAEAARAAAFHSALVTIRNRWLAGDSSAFGARGGKRGA